MSNKYLTESVIENTTVGLTEMVLSSVVVTWIALALKVSGVTMTEWISSTKGILKWNPGFRGLRMDLPRRNLTPSS